MTASDQLKLNAKSRTVTKKQVSELRSQGVVPAVLYGHGLENRLVQIDLKEFAALYAINGESTLVDLVVDEQAAVPVLIHDVTRDTITNVIQHVDFYAVNMSEKVHAEVVVHFVGVSPAVKDLNGVLVKNRDHIAIKCLPGDLVAEVEVDLGALATFEDSIHIEDIILPDTVEVLDSPTLTVATVTPPRTEEELAALDEEVTVDVDSVEGAAEEPETNEEQPAS